MAATIRRENVSNDVWAKLNGQSFNCRILISPYNRRITVYEFTLAGDHGAGEMIMTLTRKARARGLDKIWLKSESRWADAFLNAGMKLEASVPGYFRGKTPASFLSLYLSRERQTPSSGASEEWINRISIPGTKPEEPRCLPDGVVLEWGRAEHCPDLARLYGKVFPTYPFPVFDQNYLLDTMRHGVYYVTAWHQGNLVAACSAEVDEVQENAEMTDFATLPEWRARGLASILLERLESRVRDKGIKCLYTIARSSSIGMNSVFARAGYGFRGVLINNCNISGGLEDMNVWSKLIAGE